MQAASLADNRIETEKAASIPGKALMNGGKALYGVITDKGGRTFLCRVFAPPRWRRCPFRMPVL